MYRKLNGVTPLSGPLLVGPHDLEAAYAAALTTEEDRSGVTFARALLAATLETPTLSAGEIAILDREVLDAVVPTLATTLGIAALYQEVDPALPPPERLWRAHRLQLDRIFQPVADSLSRAVRLAQQHTAPIGQALTGFAGRISWLTGAVAARANQLEGLLSQAGAAVARRAGPVLDGVYAFTQVLAEVLPPTLEALASWYTREMDAILCHYGWWYAPVLPRELVEEAATMARTGRGRSISRRIC